MKLPVIEHQVTDLESIFILQPLSNVEDERTWNTLFSSLRRMEFAMEKEFKAGRYEDSERFQKDMKIIEFMLRVMVMIKKEMLDWSKGVDHDVKDAFIAYYKVYQLRFVGRKFDADESAEFLKWNRDYVSTVLR